MEQEVSFIAQTYCDEVFTWSGLKQQSNGKVDLKCCFPLAEARMKRKTFFSHTSGSLGASVRGV